MKKLRIIKVLSVLSIFGLLLGCTDLTEEPFDQLTADQIGDSEEVLAALAAPSYTRLRDVLNGWHGYFDLVNESSDLLVTAARINGGWVDGGTYRRLFMHEWNSTQAQPRQLWNRIYGALNLLNTTIDNTNPELVASIAEFRALRALYYYILLDNFGNVPLVVTSQIEEGFLPEQNTRQEVFDYVESELLEAIPDLSMEVNSQTYGRMTRYAAQMVLAKVYLNAEVWTGTPMYDKAIVATDDIINSGLFQLESSYRTNFLTENEGSSEQIFSVPYDENLGGWFHAHWKALHQNSAALTYQLSRNSWNGNAAIPQFIDTYDPDDDRFNIWLRGPQVDVNGNPIFNTQTPELRDTQLDHVNVLESIDGVMENQGFRFTKYEIAIGSVGPLANDVPLFRYADALMIKAESLLRTGSAAAAAAIVTEVRSRSFSDPVKATVTGTDLMQGSSYNYGVYQSGAMVTTEGGDDITYGRFLDELGWEFVGEFHRRQDLIRFGVYTSKSWFSHIPNGDYRMLFPIPDTAIDTNPNLTQNPGY